MTAPDRSTFPPLTDYEIVVETVTTKTVRVTSDCLTHAADHVRGLIDSGAYGAAEYDGAIRIRSIQLNPPLEEAS